jgi:hypothetical protein
MTGSSLTTMRRVIGVVLVGLTLGACAKNTSVDTTSTQPPATPTATVVTGTSSASHSASPALADGRNFGYIKAVDTGNRTVVFDLAEFLQGDAADHAAQDDGVIKPGEHVDNDYYIRNRNTRLRTVPFSGDVKIRIVDWAHCCDSKDGALQPFAASFQANGKTEEYHGPDSGYWLTVHGGSITTIEEQYVP